MKVTEKYPGGELVLAYVSKGNYFGEIGLLGGGKRTATCSALDHVEVVRISSEDFKQMLERFPTDVLPEDPVLVIWETGTTDAVRGVGVDDFAATLQTGIDKLEAHGVDIMLVDMQFSHSTATVIDFERYLNTLHRVGDVNDVNVFPRFEMMRYWSEQNVFNFDGVAKDERAGLAARVYECLAGKLAEAIRLALR